jgi:UDP-glucose 4-epimerase
VVDNLSTGRRLNLEGLGKPLEFIHGDICDPVTAARVVRGVRFVLHFAALPSVARSVQDPVMANRSNISGMLGMLVAARDEQVERFVFSSSSSVYGDTKVLPKREDMLPMPLSPYAVQKLTGEHYCRIFHDLYQLPAFSLRYFNVFGPRQDPASHYAAVIPRFIKSFLHDRPPTIYGDGKQTRDFTFVEDVVRANLACCRAPESAAGCVYNVARGDRISLLDLIQTLSKITGKTCCPIHEPARAGDVKHSQGDAGRARRILRWKPEVGLEAGLKRTLEFFEAEETQSSGRRRSA